MTKFEKHQYWTTIINQQQNALPKPTPKHHKKGRKPLPAELKCEINQHTLNSPYCDCCHEP